MSGYYRKWNFFGLPVVGNRKVPKHPIEEQNDQKCWSCRLCTGLDSVKTGRPCPNTQIGEDYGPVEGWEARPSYCKSAEEGTKHRWDLKEADYCPLYEPDDESKYEWPDKTRSIWKQ